MVNQVFDKYLEWDATAITNKAEYFKKPITDYRNLATPKGSSNPDPAADSSRSFVFNWDNGVSALFDLPDGIYYKDDVIHFKEMLKELPALKDKLANKIRNKEAQKNLFK